MGGHRRLSAGMPRMLYKHNGEARAHFRRAWRALASECGTPARGSLVALEMGRVAAAYVILIESTTDLSEARRARETGRGRRPSPVRIERLARRQSLADSSYQQALDRLRLLAERTKPLSLAERLSRREGSG